MSHSEHENAAQRFHRACYEGDLSKVQEAEQSLASVNDTVKTIVYEAGVAVAARAGHLSVIQYLHSKGINVHAMGSEAVRCALASTQMECAEWLCLNSKPIHAAKIGVSLSTHLLVHDEVLPLYWEWVRTVAQHPNTDKTALSYLLLQCAVQSDNLSLSKKLVDASHGIATIPPTPYACLLYTSPSPRDS